MPGGLRPAMMPSGPSAMSRTAAASVTIENTMSEVDATARGLSAKRMPALISGSALARERFQPVTVWPAAISRGTMPAPMAPSPMNPILIAPLTCIAFVCPGPVARIERSEIRERTSTLHHRSRISLRSIRAMASAGRGFHFLAVVAIGAKRVVAVHRDIEIVAVRIDRPILGIEAVAGTLEWRPVALLLEARCDLVVVLD